jgi:peptide chain release factor
MTKENLYWIQVTAGDGPVECALAAKKTIEFLLLEANSYGVSAELLDLKLGEEKETCISGLISIQGKNVENFIRRWEGTIQWICQSPYRTNHKRKNWFVGINILEPNNENDQLKLSDVKFETMRASGSGGQHVNTTDSAVRVTHTPTGITTISSDERSQHSNKKLALIRLSFLLKELDKRQELKKRNEKWAKHGQLERGNPTRIFIGKEFKERRNICD